VQKKSKLTVVLLTRNRNVLATQALQSLVNQDFPCFQLVISDNSNDDSFKAVVMEACAHLTNYSYVKRSPPLSSKDHFKEVLREIDSDYFVLFHDDDIARPSFISSLFSFITKNPDKAAVACNGVAIKDGVVGRRGIFFSNGEVVEILTAEDLVLKYFSLDGHGCAPWPSYMYRSEVIPLFLGSKQTLGKHSDFQLLISLFTLGDIAWLPQKLIEYRVHSLSDSAQESLKDRLSILGFLKKNFPAAADRYRFIFYLLITARYHQNSLIKNFYLSKPAVKYFICKQFAKELIAGSITSWLSYKVKRFIHT
jgi:glycosyltransferase involved in cell wall biosynthesis